MITTPWLLLLLVIDYMWLMCILYVLHCNWQCLDLILCTYLHIMCISYQVPLTIVHFMWWPALTVHTYSVGYCRYLFGLYLVCT